MNYEISYRSSYLLSILMHSPLALILLFLSATSAFQFTDAPQRYQRDLSVAISAPPVSNPAGSTTQHEAAPAADDAQAPYPMPASPTPASPGVNATPDLQLLQEAQPDQQLAHQQATDGDLIDLPYLIVIEHTIEQIEALRKSVQGTYAWEQPDGSFTAFSGPLAAPTKPFPVLAWPVTPASARRALTFTATEAAFAVVTDLAKTMDQNPIRFLIIPSAKFDAMVYQEQRSFLEHHALSDSQQPVRTKGVLDHGTYRIEEVQLSDGTLLKPKKH